MRAAWLLFSHQMRGRLRFWLAAVGYQPGERSLSDWLYYVYVALFFLAWVLAMLFLLASGLAGFIRGLPFASPPAVCALLLSLALGVWLLLTWNRASRRSPLVLSEEDAYLLAQTPIDRRPVELLGFLGSWLPAGLGFGAAAIALGFSLAEISLQGKVTPLDMPLYLTLGLRAALVVLPLQLAVHALIWSWAGLRLQVGTWRPWLRWLTLGLSLLWLALIVALPGGTGASLFDALLARPAWSWLTAPVLGAFGAGGWLGAWVATLAAALLALLVLWLSSAQLSLSRVAAETAGEERIRGLTQMGFAEAAEELRNQQRLGVDHAPSRRRARPGAGALLWKDLTQSGRVWRWRSLFGALAIPAALLVIVAPVSWGVRAWGVLFWFLMIAGRCTERLRADLRAWPLLQPLPVAPRALLAAEVARPAMVALLLSVIGMGAAVALGWAPSWAWLVLAALPGGLASLAFLAARDVLRQCGREALLAGAVPGISLLALVLAVIFVGLPLEFGLLLQGSAGSLLPAAGVTLIGELGLGALAWLWAASSYAGLS